MQINFQRLDPMAISPRRANPGDAGLDLASRIDCVIEPGQFLAVPTGIAIAIPRGYAGLVLPRSGLARRHGLSLVNTPGLIDSGYRGEIEILLINHGPDRISIETGQRIAQLVIVGVAEASLQEVPELDPTERGPAGFGSSGR
ncbi:MAG TPA: dUTP diphosphatase [Acidimicrobiia bacterium]|nr:dUTP diphosphatase [Acidimicrobiia bacterium]